MSNILNLDQQASSAQLAAIDDLNHRHSFPLVLT
jgi:hypothetical protein